MKRRLRGDEGAMERPSRGYVIWIRVMGDEGAIFWIEIIHPYMITTEEIKNFSLEFKFSSRHNWQTNGQNNQRIDA